MFAYVKGVFQGISEGVAIVEACGLGYELTVSGGTAGKLPPRGKEITLYSYMSVREDGVFLYGFYSLEEKNMFLKLISVTGIGPKAAMNILSGMELTSLALAIISSDAKSLSKVKGVGKKTAERIILELKEKISAEQADGGDISSPASVAGENVTPDMADAIAALRTLGITQQEAVKAVTAAKPRSQTIEQLIANALKSLGV